MKRSFRIFAILAISALSFVVCANFISYLRPQHVYPPFSIDHSFNQKYVHNGSGARGPNYMGQKYRVAILGASASYGLGTDQNKTWFHYLSKHLGEQVHIESYGTDSVGDRALIKLLQQFQAQNKQYDLLIIMHTFFTRHRRNIFRRTNQNNVIGLHGIPQALDDWWQSKTKSSRIINLLGKDSKSETRGNPPKVNFFFDGDFRKKAEQQGWLVKVDTPWDQKAYEYVRRTMKEFDDLARTVSTKQIYLSNFFAYTEGTPKQLTEKFQILKRVENTKNLFYDADSLSRYLGFRAQTNQKAAKELGLTFFDWRPILLPKLLKNPDLFIDEAHLSDTGSFIFARSILPLVEKNIGFKNENTGTQ